MTRGKQIGFGCLGAFLLVVIGSVGTIFVIATGGARLLERELEAWKAIGGVVDPLDLQPDPIPDERNAAVIYARAFEAMSPLRRRFDDWTDEQLAPEVAAEYAEAIALLHKAARMPECVWPIGPTLDDLLEFSPRFRDAAKLLSVEANAAHAAGDDLRAAQAIASTLRLSSHLDEVPLIIGMLVRLSLDAMALSRYEEMFRDRIDRSSSVYEALKARDSRRFLRSALLSEVVWALSQGEEMLKEEFGGRLMLAGLSRDRALYVSLMRRTVEELDKPLHEADFSMLDDENLPWWAKYTQMSLPANAGSIRVVINFEARVALARAAIDLRAWRDEHGRYPDPAEYEPPIDPAGGRPFEYELDGDGFILRSAATLNDQPIEWRWN